MSPNPACPVKNVVFQLFQLTQQLFVVKIDKNLIYMLNDALIVDDRDFGAEK